MKSNLGFKALRENWVPFHLFTIGWLDTLKIIEKIIWKGFKKALKKPG